MAPIAPRPATRNAVCRRTNEDPSSSLELEVESESEREPEPTPEALVADDGAVVDPVDADTTGAVSFENTDAAADEDKDGDEDESKEGEEDDSRFDPPTEWETTPTLFNLSDRQSALASEFGRADKRVGIS